MRALWTVISTLALANLLALGVFAGWLAGTQRLSMERAEALREMFAETVPEEEARLKQEEREAAAREAEEAELARVGTPAVRADQRMRIIRDYLESERLRDQRVQREADDLIKALEVQRAEFYREREAFEERVAAWEAMRERLTELQASEQFEKTVATYQGLKPAQARAMLQTLIDDGEMFQAVAYLDAMQRRAATKVVAEFEKDDAGLAAELLERLRGLGVDPPAAEDAQDADDQLGAGDPDA